MLAALPIDRPPSPAIAARPATAPAVRLAIAIAVLITLVRAAIDWPQLSVGLLPDNDDMMRLAEVRDWLGGQGFHDLFQHRLGLPPGTPMHWSRIADLGPAAIIALLTPLAGEHEATLAMLVGYQGALFLAYLLLAARNARALIGAPAMTVAVLLAALAFPTFTLFRPGRIDHHALQIVLSMVVVGTIVARPSWRGGVAGGVAAAVSMAVGLEVAPELVAAIVTIGLQWLVGGRAETARLGGFAAAFGLATLALYLTVYPSAWSDRWCDGFTPASTSASFAGAIALGGAALAGMRWPRVGPRLLIAAVGAAAAMLWVIHAAPACLAGPYGALDPFLKAAFMDNVGEAQGLFGQASPGLAIANGGLALASLAALAVLMRDPARRRRWWPFAVFLIISVAAMIWQIRIAYILAGIATLPFVALMDKARADDNLVRRLALWVLGSGIVYNLAGAELDRVAVPAGSPAAGAPTAGRCLEPGPLQALAALPPGNVMAPIDLGAAVIGLTPHRSFAAVYHRDGEGNMAMYRFFLARPAQAESIARRLGVAYVVACPASLAEHALDRWRGGSLIEALQQRRPPAWLQPVIAASGGMSIYRVR